jgi:magnesium-transporting ATPase (P-type)
MSRRPTNNNGYLFTGERRHSRAEKDDDEDEDLDMLIEELESLDPDEQIEVEMQTVAGQRTVPEELLQTDTTVGLVEPEVIQRRRKYGLNQMKEERENLFLKFLGYFVGPIQFVMEVGFARDTSLLIANIYRLLPFSLPVWRTGSTLVSSAPSYS